VHAEVYLHAVLLLELKVLLPQGVDTVNHDLDKLDLGVAKTMLVGDVISVTSLATRLASGTSGLDSELLASSLQLVNTLLGPAGKVNVDRSSHTSTKIGGAGVDITVTGIQSKVLSRLGLDRVTNSLDTTGQTFKDTLDVATLLHGDDSGLILLIDPEQEGLGLIVEDTSALGPVTLHTGNLKVSITRHEEEVVINKLLADSLIHASQGVVGTSKVTGQLGQSRAHQLLNVNSLLLGDTGRQTETINVAANTDSGGVNRHLRVNVAIDLGGVHVRGVLSIGRDAVVLLNQRVKDNGKVLVGVPATSIDTTVLVVKLNGAGASLGQGESAGLGLDVLQLVPFLLGDVLGHKGVLRLDFREFSGHLTLLEL